jgi:hypothetical protein
LARQGGAILKNGSGTLSLSDCAFTDNEALGDASGGGNGGAIENLLGTLLVSHCSFDANKAVAIGPNFPAVPGNIFATGGAIDTLGSSTITDSTFTGNQALGGSPGASSGGGALNSSDVRAGVTMTVVGCFFGDNAAIGAAGGDGMANFGSGQAGAINSFSDLVVRNSILTGNVAQGAPLAPGAAPSQTESSGSETGGGGIASLGHAMTIADTALIGNMAIGGAGAAGSADSVAGGGGILRLGTAPASSVCGCVLAYNVALGGAGGDGGVGGDAVSGGIDLSFGVPLTVSNTLFLHNQAIGGAGGSGARGGDGIGGAIGVGTGVLFGFADTSSLTLTGSTFVDNEAQGGAGGSGSNGGNALGGGLAVLGKLAGVSDSTIRNNQALGGAGDTEEKGGDGFGGGVYIATGARLKLTGCTVTTNQANGGEGDGGSAGNGVGGGVYNLGVFTPDDAAVIAMNKASTSNDDIFP